MQPGITDILHGDLGHIEVLLGEMSDGVMLVDAHQTIVWANRAALAMHGVSDIAALGHSIDDYHANFQVRFRGARAAAEGERAPDAVIEITPPCGDGQRRLHRLRKLPLAGGAGFPRHTALILEPVVRGAADHGKTVSFIQTAPGAVAVLRRQDNAIIAANAAFHRLVRLDLSHGADIGAAALLIARSADPRRMTGCIAGAAPFAFMQTSLPDADGQPRPVLLAGQPGEYAGEDCMILQIAEWDAVRPAVAGATLQDADSVPAAALDLCAAAPGAVFVLDGDMRIAGASKAWLEWLGHTAEAAIGRPVTDFMAVSSGVHFSNQTWSTLAAGGVVRDHACQFVRRSGETVYALLAAHGKRRDDGTVAQAVVMALDLTEQKRLEDSFSTLFALSPTPLLVRRLEDNRILDVNDAFVAMTGFSAEASIGHGVDELWHFNSAANRQAAEQDLRAGKRVRDAAVTLRTHSGETLDGMLCGQRVTMFGQNCVLLAVQDITDRRRNETELFAAIETVMQDTGWFTQSVIEKLATLRRPAQPGVRVPEIGDLTPREREVLGLISHGMTDTDIAEKLGLTRCTVRNHVATLYSKIGVHSRSSAIVWARERGVNLAPAGRGAASFMRQAQPVRRIVLAAKMARP